MVTIDSATIETLAANFAGELVQPQDPRFDATRRVWNGHVQRRRALIARFRGAADVIATVRLCSAGTTTCRHRCGAAGTPWRGTPSVRTGWSSTCPA